MKESKKLFEEASKIIPGGVNSPVRAFKSINSTPIYINEGRGSHIIDEDNNIYLDFCASWGPLILGHAYQPVIDAVKHTVVSGLSFGTCNKLEIEMASLITEAVSNIDMFRAVNSGTEATMTALRLARGFTKRNKILKFDGCYHGHADYLLVSAGSGLLTSGVASSAGISDKAISEVIVVPYNDKNAVQEAFKKYKDEIACIIVEPIAGNMGLVESKNNFLSFLRDITIANSSLLIFDEVITGFRLGATSYGDLVGIKPDLTCLGKIIGGGMPLAGFGGRRDIMMHLAPEGDVYQAGTLSGNPVALSAGIATLTALLNCNPYEKLANYADHISSELNKFAQSADKPMKVVSKGGLFTLFFTDRDNPLENLEDVRKCDTNMFAEYFNFMIANSIYISPSQFELGFISDAHTKKDIDKFINTVKEFWE